MPVSVIQPEDNRVSQYRILFRELRASAFIVTMLLLFVGLAFLVHASGTISIDLKVTEFVQKLRSPVADVIANVITNFGNIGVLIGTTVIGCGFLLTFRKYKSTLFAVASLLSYPINVYIKNFVDRARPTSALVQIISPAGGFSFPSGHAMLSMTVYGTLAYLLWVYLRSSYRPLIIVLVSIVILLIGISRIYLGVHWFTDVLGGWIAGLFLLAIIIQIHKRVTAEAALPLPPNI